MVFSTIIFLLRFLPITLALYYLAPPKLKNTVLFLCSLVFYCWGEVRFFPVMLALNAVLGDLRAIKAQGADVVVFRTRSRESSLVIDEMLAMGTDVTPFVLAHNGGEAQLTINGAAHNELIH